LFEEEDSDCEEEEFNEEDGGHRPVDPLGRTLDARPTARRSGPRVSQPAASREAAGAVFRKLAPGLLTSAMQLGAAPGGIEGYTVQCLACVQKHNHVLTENRRLGRPLGAGSHAQSVSMDNEVVTAVTPPERRRAGCAYILDSFARGVAFTKLPESIFDDADESARLFADAELSSRDSQSVVMVCEKVRRLCIEGNADPSAGVPDWGTSACFSVLKFRQFRAPVFLMYSRTSPSFTSGPGRNVASVPWPDSRFFASACSGLAQEFVLIQAFDEVSRYAASIRSCQNTNCFPRPSSMTRMYNDCGRHTGETSSSAASDAASLSSPDKVGLATALLGDSPASQTSASNSGSNSASISSAEKTCTPHVDSSPDVTDLTLDSVACTAEATDADMSLNDTVDGEGVSRSLDATFSDIELVHVGQVLCNSNCNMDIDE
jgi:hypothetical protein